MHKENGGFVMNEGDKVFATLNDDVVVREEVGFGGTIYVHHRNDFFIVDRQGYSLIAQLLSGKVPISIDDVHRYERLAKLGICKVNEQTGEEEAYSGPSLIGRFVELPSVANPLLVNVFTSSTCFLDCVYCYAKDLMDDYFTKETSNSNWIEKIVYVLSNLNPMTIVATGGDPLANIGRTRLLIERVAHLYPTILDISGIGNLESLLDLLQEKKVHVRISLDSLGVENDKWRKSPRSEVESISSLAGARRAIEICERSGINYSVQTVIHSRNDSYQQIVDLRDGLLGVGVKNWIIHLVANTGGKRRQKIKYQKSKITKNTLIPSPNARRFVSKMIVETMNGKLPIDIRCTDSCSAPNSVLLLDSVGNLCTEGFANIGKVFMEVPRKTTLVGPEKLPFLDWAGHTRRYINWNKWQFGQKEFTDSCYLID